MLLIMTHERYAQIGTVVSLMAVMSFFASFFVPMAKLAPGYEDDFLLQLQIGSRVILFYGSGVLFAAACVFWRLSRVPR